MSYVITKKTKTDCFAYQERSCAILIDRECDNKNCCFYKTHEEFKRTRTPARLTNEQSQKLINKGISPENWLLAEENNIAMTIYNMKTKETRTIPKRGQATRTESEV